MARHEQDVPPWPLWATGERYEPKDLAALAETLKAVEESLENAKRRLSPEQFNEFKERLLDWLGDSDSSN